MSDSGENKISAEKSFHTSEGKIFLSKDGRWFHEGVEITHQRTIELFSRSVVKSPSGGYQLRIGKECAEIEVEDTPYMVCSVECESERVRIFLNDRTVEDLNPETLWIGKENVLYCRVKGGEFPARFLRPAYYQIMQFLNQDENGFYLQLGNKRWRLYEK